jgi:hypothetical protein
MNSRYTYFSAHPSVHKVFMHALRPSITINCTLKLTKKIYHVKAISPHSYLTVRIDNCSPAMFNGVGTISSRRCRIGGYARGEAEQRSTDITCGMDR